jgi:hypothetical protein
MESDNKALKDIASKRLEARDATAMSSAKLA